MTRVLPHMSPKTGGQQGPRQHAKGPFPAQGVQPFLPQGASGHHPVGAAGPGCDPSWGSAPTWPRCTPDIHTHSSASPPRERSGASHRHGPSCGASRSCGIQLGAKILPAPPSPTPNPARPPSTPGSGRAGSIAGTQEECRAERGQAGDTEQGEKLTAGRCCSKLRCVPKAGLERAGIAPAVPKGTGDKLWEGITVTPATEDGHQGTVEGAEEAAEPCEDSDSEGLPELRSPGWWKKQNGPRRGQKPDFHGRRWQSQQLRADTFRSGTGNACTP